MLASLPHLSPCCVPPQELEALQKELPRYLRNLRSDDANVLEWHVLLLPVSGRGVVVLWLRLAHALREHGQGGRVWARPGLSFPGILYWMLCPGGLLLRPRLMGEQADALRHTSCLQGQ